MQYATVKDHDFRDPRYLLLRTRGIIDMFTLQEELNIMRAKVLTTTMNLELAQIDTDLIKTRSSFLDPEWIIVEADEAILFIIKYSNRILARLDQEDIEIELNSIRVSTNSNKLTALGELYERHLIVHQLPLALYNTR